MKYEGEVHLSVGERFFSSKILGKVFMGPKTFVQEEISPVSFCSQLWYKGLSSSNSVYRALCDVWCPKTNTFVTAGGKIDISLWDICEISELSVMGHYYEKVVPNLSEVTYHLPKSCLYIFNVFSLIANTNESDCIAMKTRINFGFMKRVVLEIFNKRKIIRML